MDKQELLTLAGQIAGAAEGETALLKHLCGAACADLTARLLPEADPAVSGDALLCAAAFSAAADLLASREQTGEFHAGDVSFRTDCAGRIETLRRRAAHLLAPYAAAEDFAFRGVRA